MNPHRSGYHFGMYNDHDDEFGSPDFDEDEFDTDEFDGSDYDDFIAREFPESVSKSEQRTSNRFSLIYRIAAWVLLIFTFLFWVLLGFGQKDG